MLQARPHAIHFKRILDFGEGQDSVFVQPFSGEDNLASNKADAFLP
jgi:hypothetical protein